MTRLALLLFFTLLGSTVAHAADDPGLEQLAFLAGEFSGTGKHPYGQYDETIKSDWTLGGTALEFRSKSVMGEQTVFEDLRVFSFDAAAKKLRMRQWTAGLLREYTGATTDDGGLVFTETAHEGTSAEAWRYTFSPKETGGFTYRVDTQTNDAAAWKPYVSGALTAFLKDPSKGGGMALRQYTTTIDGMSAEIHHPDGTGPFPALVFSPGGGASTTEGYAAYGRWYATWGYVTVIVAFDDTDAAERAPKFSKIADWLVAENTRDGAPLGGLIDTTRLAAAGHSRGGNAALRAARADARFVACLALAPSGPNEAIEGPGAARTCIFGAEKDDLLPAAKAAYDTTPGERYLIEVAGMTHMLAPRESTLKVVARSTAFLNHALAGDTRYRAPLVAEGAGLTITSSE